MGSSEEMFPANNRNVYMSKTKTKTLSLSKSPKNVYCKLLKLLITKLNRGLAGNL
jgi:hypothetical protein